MLSLDLQQPAQFLRIHALYSHNHSQGAIAPALQIRGSRHRNLSMLKQSGNVRGETQTQAACLCSFPHHQLCFELGFHCEDKTGLKLESLPPLSSEYWVTARSPHWLPTEFLLHFLPGQLRHGTGDHSGMRPGFLAGFIYSRNFY